MLRQRRRQEDLISVLLHGLGVACAIAALSVLTVLGAYREGAAPVLLMILYGITLTFSYGASTLYHLFRTRRIATLFQTLDHIAIYLLIAGTTTVPAVLALHDHLGWLLALISWSLAALGILGRLFLFRRLHSWSPYFYLLMGFAVAAWAGPIVEVMGVGALLLILGGGLSYAVGVVFFGWNRLPFNNVIWHVFVIGGSVCHFLAIVLYVLPLADA